MNAAAITILATGIAALLIGGLARWRFSAYNSWLRYDPSRDVELLCFRKGVETFALDVTNRGFAVPDLPLAGVSGFVELTLQATLAGRFRDPYLELEAGSFRDIQYFERGVAGRRLVNVTRLLSSDIKPGQEVVLRGRGLKWGRAGLRLHVSYEGLRTDDRVVIVAPHPDDAELAAFGLYSSAQGTTVVTVTAGDNTDRFDRKEKDVATPLSRDVVARLRVWDSIFIPAIGGVPSQRAMNLCYPDGRLAEMYADKAREFDSRGGLGVNLPALRELNTSHLLNGALGAATHRCSWESLINDLMALFSHLRPSVIVAPMPMLDSHPDHGLTTKAICEALRGCGLMESRLFLYTVNNRWTQLYPFGPAGSGVSWPPCWDMDSLKCDGFFSFPVSTEGQTWKRLALQAMHDVADFSYCESPDIGTESKRLKAATGARLRGLSNPPHSYFRRAVRPDEIFFVLDVEQAERIADDHARQVVEGSS